MNLRNRFKYRLLVWLLGDICEKTVCDECEFNTGPMHCFMNECHYQARKTWRIE